MHKSALVTVTMVTTALLHIFWCFLLTQIVNLDFQGIGLATLISYVFNVVMLTVLCTTMSDLKPSFFFFKSDTLKHLGAYLKIGISSAFMLCLEWGALEILAILANFISLDAVGAQVLALNTFVVLMMVPFGG